MKVFLARLRRSGGLLAVLVVIVLILGGVLVLRRPTGAAGEMSTLPVSAAASDTVIPALAQRQVPTPVARPASVPLPEQPLPTADRTALAEQVLLEAPAHDLLNALSCTRTQQGKAALTLDPALVSDATALWKRLTHDPSLDLRQAASGMRLVALLPLDLGAEVPGEGADGCGFGGLDLATLELEDVTAVGIVVVRDETADAEADDATALILGR